MSEPPPSGAYPPAGPDEPHRSAPAAGLPGASTPLLGPRALRRPEARFGVSLAAVGMVLVVVGVVVWATNYVGSGITVDFDSDTAGSSGGGRRFLGAALGAVVAVAGYAVLIKRRQGPVATAGVIGVVLGVPIALIFLTLDLSGLRGDPVNVDLVALVSVLVWLASYLVVPGARGRAVLLGLAATVFVSYLEYKAGSVDSVTSAAGVLGGDGRASTGDIAIGLGFGLVYYLIAFLLDRGGRSGVAIALVFSGFAATTSGIVAAAGSLGRVGLALLLIVIGVLVGSYGGRFGRRFTTWAWSAAVAVGVGLLVQKALPHNATGAGVTLIVVGVLVIILGEVFASLTREPTDIPDYLAAPAR